MNLHVKKALFFLFANKELKQWEAKWLVDDKLVTPLLESMSFNLFLHDIFFYSQTRFND